jgi:hypothetical protein
MADLFTLTSPLMIRYPDNSRHVMVACFRHPHGILYFRPLWDQLPDGEGIQDVTGDLKGEGLWKVDEAVITVLGCQGANPQQAGEFADWTFHLQQCGEQYPLREDLENIARVRRVSSVNVCRARNGLQGCIHAMVHH